MAKKNYYLLIDTETAGDFSKPLIYDLGMIVVDRNGKVIEQRDFLIGEIFYNGTLMATAFYYGKIPEYLDMIRLGKVEVSSFAAALDEMDNLIEKYSIQGLMAYNASFDYKALRMTANELLIGEENFNLNIPVMDIYAAAARTILNKRYIQFCEKNNFLTEKGNVKTSAEIVFRYLTGNLNFEEAHTAIEDCLIEKEIMKKVFDSHKKIDWTPTSAAWRIVNSKR